MESKERKNQNKKTRVKKAGPSQVVSDIDGGSNEDISSSSKEEEGSIEQRLEKFRDSWKRELKLKSKTPEAEVVKKETITKSEENQLNSDNLGTDANEISDIERQAITLFEKGISLEYRGKLYDAVAYYRRATQLVPDIESKIYSLEKLKNQKQVKPADQSATRENIKHSHDEEIELDEEENLLVKFNSLNLNDNGTFFICQPEHPVTNSLHFSLLPCEVVLYILRWIVSDELDLQSLESFGQVCRGFYVLARDPEIWKLACLRIWSITSIDQSLHSIYNGNWRTMFIEKPRININGAYISKASYIRQGESSFQDVNYRPCYLIEYYRYLRFFPGGVLLMLNTPDDPYQSLSKLKFQNTSYPAVLKGHYIIQGNRISAVLKSRSTSTERVTFGKRGHKTRLVVSEKEYQLQLEIRNTKKGRNSQLVWLNYTVIFKKNDGDQSVNIFDLNLTKFPPFWFSRVKSYTNKQVDQIISHEPSFMKTNEIL